MFFPKGSEMIQLLIDISREFGSDSRYVIAGGGNSSIKADGVMYVKGSGSRMGSITAEGFVAMDLEKMSVIWNKTYSPAPDRREEEVLADLLAARKPGEENKRPSVETLLHGLFPERLVMHTHPALVNGLTCGISGEQTVADLFGTRALWIPLTEPGYILAKVVRDAMKTAGGSRKIVFLQNHGVFVAGDSPEEIREIYSGIFAAIEAHIQFPPVCGTLAAEDGMASSITEILKGFQKTAPVVRPFMDKVLNTFLQSKQDFRVLEHSLTPDHIVYSGFLPLFAENIETLSSGLKDYSEKNGELPKIIAVKNRCCFACTSSEKASVDASDLFLDAAKVVTYTRSFGGPLPMTERLVSFIRTWEAEKYRQNKT